MASLKALPFAALASAIALLAVPMSGLPGNTPFMPLNIVVQVRPSASFKIQNAADLIPSGFTQAITDAPVLVLNTPPVRPDVVIEVSADVAGPVMSLPSVEGAGEDGTKVLSLKDLGVAPPAPMKRAAESTLTEAFERAASEIVYRLDLLNRVNVGRQNPVVISINL